MSSLKSIYKKIRVNYFWNELRLPEISLSSLIPNLNIQEPLITEKLSMPPYLGIKDHNDITPLLGLVKSLHPARVLELGTAYGTTVANICAISQAMVYTVNALPEQLDREAVTFTLTKDEIGYVYRKYGYGDRVVQIYENTRNLNPVDYMPPHCIDLVIIDACHEVDCVISDFLMVQPVIHNKSIIFLHDVNPNLQEHLIESYVACMYLRKLGFNLMHLQDTWWGIWNANTPHSYLRGTGKILNILDNILIKTTKHTISQDAINIKWYFQNFRNNSNQ